MQFRPPSPVVLVSIDKNSRLHIKQTDGVLTAFVDERVDGYAVVLLPEDNESEAILAEVKDKPVVSQRTDIAGTAAAAIRQIRAGLIVVAGGPETREIEETP